MVRRLTSTEDVVTSSFGSFCPYWTQVDGSVLVADTAEEIISALPPERRVIDPVAVLELLQFNYMLGNRTLVQGVFRVPWRARLRGDGTLERRSPVPHGELRLDAADVASKLRLALEEELLNVTSGRTRIYLLTTGGLDSRVTAGIMKQLEPRIGAQIVCCTWGSLRSRDVAYAQQIAKWCSWGFQHIPYGEEACWDNIRRGATWGGSEVAGVHLHGMDWFHRADRRDLVLASSFGDSIGRAEFSGVHVTNLRFPPICNTAGLIHHSIARPAIAQAEVDRTTAWEGDYSSELHVRCELDQQENYMRRMIAHAMNYIQQFCSLHQVLTSEAVVSLMWSLAPDCRTDKIYHALLASLDTRLTTLPWARTGVAPDGTVEKDTSLTPSYHQYAEWCHGPLRSRLQELYFSEGLDSLGLFSRPARRACWDRFVGDLHSYELVVKMCSIELSRRHFGLLGCRQPSRVVDEIRSFCGRGARRLARQIGM